MIGQINSGGKPINLNLKNLKFKQKKNFEGQISKGIVSQTSPESSNMQTIQNNHNFYKFSNRETDEGAKVLSARKKAVLGVEPLTQTVTSTETTSKLEKLIQDMLQRGTEIQSANRSAQKTQIKIEDHNDQSIVRKVKGFNTQMQIKHQGIDSFNLNSFLDVQIKPSDNLKLQTLQPNYVYNQPQNPNSNKGAFKDEPTIQNENLFQKTVAAQRRDFEALQEIERNKQEIQKRIKDRYTVLRSISRKHQRKGGSMIPQDIVANSRMLADSNMRPVLNKYDFHPYQQTAQSLNLIIGGGGQNKTSRRTKRHNKTTFINPSNIEFYSGRITALNGNNSIFYNQSPTVLSKTSTIQNNSSIISGNEENLNNSSIQVIQQHSNFIHQQQQIQGLQFKSQPQNNSSLVMSAKKISRIQRKKIVINENFNQMERDQLDLTPNRNTMKNQYHQRQGSGNYSQLRQRPQRFPFQQSNLRSASSTLRHNRTKSVGHAQNRSYVPIATQYYQIQQHNKIMGSRDYNQQRSHKNKINSLSPPDTIEKEQMNNRADSVPLTQNDILNNQKQSLQYTNLLNIQEEPQITMISEEFKMDRSRVNQSKREIRRDIQTFNTIGTGGGEDQIQNQQSINFNIRQKLNFRYVPGEDAQRYNTVDTDRELLQEKDIQRAKQSQNLSLNILQEIRNHDQDAEMDDDNLTEEIVDHIKIENGQIIVSDSIAMNSSMPLDQINQILNTHEIDLKEINEPKIETAFNTPQNKQDFVFQSNIINTKNARMKNGWREQAGESDSAGMSKTTLSTQRPLLSGGVIGLGNSNIQHQYTNQNKLTSKARLLSYQRGRFSSDSSFIKLRQTTGNNQINPQFKHSTAIDGEESQCKFEGEYEREEHNNRYSNNQNFNLNFKMRYNQEDMNFGAHSLAMNRISQVNNGGITSAGLHQMQIQDMNVGVGQIQEEEEYVEDEDSKKSQVKLTGERGFDRAPQVFSGGQITTERAGAAVPVSRVHTGFEKDTLPSEDSIPQSTNRILSGGALNRKNYVENNSVVYEESKCNLLNSNRTVLDSSEQFESQLKKDTQLSSSDLNYHKNSLQHHDQNLKLYQNPPVFHHHRQQSYPFQNQWLIDQNDEDTYNLNQFNMNFPQQNSSPAINKNEAVLHSDDEIEIRRGLEPSTDRSINPKEPEFLRQSTHSLLGFKKNNNINNNTINNNKTNQNTNFQQIKNSTSNQMIIDDCYDEELRAQLDVDLDDQDMIEEVDDETDPPSRLLYFNQDSYENFLKNADNFIK